MHEFSIAEALKDRVLNHLRPGMKLERVCVRVGALRRIDTDALELAWGVLIAGEEIDGVTLELIETEGDELLLQSLEVQDGSPSY